MEDNYTSLELSKKISKGGFKGDSEYHHQERFWKQGTVTHDFCDNKGWHVSNKRYDFESQYLINDSCFDIKKINRYPAFDILNDICCRYADKFFGKEYIDCYGVDYQQTAMYYYPVMIQELLIQGNKTKAEAYIWENCLFNPANK